MFARLRSIALVAALFASSADAGSVWVALPAGSTCRFEDVAASLSARLPAAEVRAGAARGADDVLLRFSLADKKWVLAIDAPNQPGLERPLEVAAQDCVALSEAAALITERYLESIQWVASSVEAQPLPPAPPPPPHQLSVAVGGGVGIGLTRYLPTGQLDLGWRWDGWSAEVSLAYLGGGEVPLITTTRPATEFHQTAAAGLALGRHLRFGPNGIRLALDPGVELFWVGSRATDGTASPNPLPHHPTVFSALPYLGAQAGYEVFLTRRISLGIRAQARVHLGTNSFVVEGYSTSLVTRVVDGELTLVLGCLFF